MKERQKLDPPFFIDSEGLTATTTNQLAERIVICPECEGHGVYYKTTGTICRKCGGDRVIQETIVEVRVYHKLPKIQAKEDDPK